MQEVQHIGQKLQDEAQDIKDQLGGKVESTAQEVQCLRQELQDVAQDIKDRLELGGQPNSSAGGQLVYFFFKVKYFSFNTGRVTCAVLTVTCILTEMASYIFEAENCQLFVI